MTDNKLPWYLKEKVLFVLCFILPPIAYFIVMANKKKLGRKRYLELLTFSTLMVSIWLLKFLPNLLYFLILLIIILALIFKPWKK
ncbi:MULTISPECIES: hypothetical protein [Bacillaceae]|nr:hypothetical protein [Bacillus sp. Au-Bac7]MCE4048110.1 hypothetical protein [Bacillus sp. Au-Bac7]